MKQWKLVLVALLAVLLVCACTSAMADETTTAPHQCTPDQVTVPATCGTDGSITRYLCSDPECPLGRYVKQVEVLYATGNHAASVNYKTDMPTCTEEGKDYFRCPTCLKNLTEKVIPALGHDMQANATIKAATCEAEGTVRYVCANGCGKVEDRATKALGHKKVVNEYIKASCGVEGATIWGCLNGCGQTWTEVTAPAKTHNFTVLYDHKDPTCTEDGHNIYACANNCGNLSEKEVIPAIGHNFTAVYDYVAPTCTTKGSETFACANNCGNLSETKEIPALGHTWKFDKTVAATCTEDGYDRYECEVCHAGEARNVVKAAHKYDKLVNNVDSTCLTAGTQTWECTVCGSQNIVALPKADHIPESHWVVTVPASCTLDGVETLYCSGCGIVLDERALTAPGHTADEVTVVVAATCLEDGYGYIYCKKCGGLMEAVVVPATGHDLEDKIIIDATCVLDGLKNIKCTECDYEEKNVVIKAEGHKGEWKVTTPATPEADGQAKKICSVCEQELDRKVVPYTVRRYSNTATAFGPCTRDLIGGSEWARVTPIDLSVEGTFTYPLIASNQYIIGTVTVTIANGSFVVNYDTAASQIKVTAEALLVYADKAALAAGTAEACAFGAPIQIGEDTKVILSVLLTVDYDAIGAGVTGFAADEAQIEAMKAIMD